MKLGAKIFGALGCVLILYLLVGFLMPGTWTAKHEAFVSSPPSEVFPLLNRMDGWQLWAPMPESGSELFGPREGVGAGIRWADPQYGKGQIRITRSLANTEVAYSVDVEGGALLIAGVFTLTPQGSGTQIKWTEAGDFGWNPLMGYAARGMGPSQTEAMRASMEQLILLLEKSPGSASTHDLSTETAGSIAGG